MKQHRFYALPALLLACCLALTACGSSYTTASSSSSAAAAAPSARNQSYDSPEMASVEMAADMAMPSGNAISPAPVDSTRKIVCNAWLTMETKEFDQTITALTALITENGGYLQNQHTSGRSIYNDGYYSRNASMTARVPADRLDAIIGTADGICNIVSRELSADDITDQYFDSEARLRALSLQEERLLEILSKAVKLEDIFELERALTEVRYQIESLTASLRRMDDQVAYSTLSIELSEVVDYQQTVTAPKSFGERVSAAWTRSCSRIAIIAEGLLFFAIAALPSILIFIVIPITLILLIIRTMRRRHKKSSPVVTTPAAKQPEQKES